MTENLKKNTGFNAESDGQTDKVMKKKEKQMLALVDVQAVKSIWTPLLSYICEFLIIVSLFH